MVVDLFAGCGGWDVGARALGMDPVGFEWDADACATRAVVGMPTVRCVLAAYPFEHMRGRVRGLIASPPCQAFSTAGKGLGRDDPRGALVDVPLAWALALEPEWIAWEQVPPVLPIWQEHAYRLEQAGYRCWTGVLCAADYGVPQTRRRAILLARKDRRPVPPVPSHDEVGGLFTQRWVSMADALGWGRLRPSPTLASATSVGGPHGIDGGSGTRAVLRAEQERGEWVLQPGSWADGRGGNRRTYDSDEPAPTLCVGNDSAGWKFTLDRRQQGAPVLDVTEQPAPTVTGTALGKGVWKAQAWPYERPATSVCADPRLSPPGYRGRPDDYDEDGTYTGERSMDNAIRLAVRDALILQSFPPDYPVQGSRTAQFRQIGNAVPPVLAARLLEAVA